MDHRQEYLLKQLRGKNYRLAFKAIAQLRRFTGKLDRAVVEKALKQIRSRES